MRRTSRTATALVFTLVALLAATAWPVAAQGTPPDSAELRRMVEERFGPGATPQQVLTQLRAQGMTNADIRARLVQMGYPPALVERYMDAVERGGDIQPLQVPSPDDLAPPADSPGADPDSVRADSVRTDSARRAAREARIFGRSLFARSTEQFRPIMSGPVPPDYRLGPGDEVWLILTGDVESSYPLTVTREGFIFVPEVGQIPVNGLTLAQLEDRLYTYLGRAFSGVRRGPEASTRFHITMGSLRSNQIFVVGEVERPSAYTVSSLARAFNALYHAGGPSEIGSFREIHVRRDGREVAVVDLYPYLLRGDASNDVRLEQGDIVFVPPAGPRVTVAGAVRRPGIYELRPGETLEDVLTFAGGLESDAFAGRIQIDRILPVDERTPGKERAIVDIPLERLATLESRPVTLRGGDSITVYQVEAERRNRVTVTGGVRRPGDYEWTPGMTLQDLVAQAQGLEEGAYTERVLVYRLQEDRTRRMLRAAVEPGEDAALPLADRDSVVVLQADSLRLPMLVSIAGFVKNPGVYPLAEGMSVRDLILAAGGFTEGAHVRTAEVARVIPTGERSGTIAEVATVPLALNGETGLPRDGVPQWEPEAGEFELVRGDRVYIRRAPGYEPPRSVKVTGEVMLPGEYELGARDTRISDVIARAGGATAEAYTRGFTIIRDGRPIAGDLTEALVDPSAAGNILLEAGDSLHVPGYDGTVQISGAVLLEANVLYERGRSLGEYIARAGGYAENANRDQVVVTYPNGERAIVDHFLVFRKDPIVEPGSSIFVPTLPPEEQQGVDWGDVISRSTAVISTLVTLYLALNN